MTGQRQYDAGWFNFCKTARKPYDLAVSAILLRAHLHLGFTLGSDGDWDQEWQYGSMCWSDQQERGYGTRQLVADLFGQTFEVCPFERETVS